MLKGPKAAFILELPTYKLPQPTQVARTVWVNTKEFLTKAGTIIFCLSVLLWAMAYYPRLPEAQQRSVLGQAANAALQESVTKGDTVPYKGKLLALSDTSEQIKAAMAKAVASAQLRHSLAGRFGHAIEPLIKPLGYDWKMGVGLVSAFAAREVFVSTMAITYSAGDADNTADLSTAMRNDRYPDGRPVWTPLVAVSLLVWFVLAMQCMSTMAIVRRETGGWKWPIAMLVYMNVLAYVVCLAVFQVGRIWFA